MTTIIQTLQSLQLFRIDISSQTVKEMITHNYFNTSQTAIRTILEMISHNYFITSIRHK